MIKMVLVTARDRARLTEITGVLVRYGLQDIAHLFGLSSSIVFAGIIKRVDSAARPCVYVRRWKPWGRPLSS